MKLRPAKSQRNRQRPTTAILIQALLITTTALRKVTTVAQTTPATLAADSTTTISKVTINKAHTATGTNGEAMDHPTKSSQHPYGSSTNCLKFIFILLAVS